MESKEIVVEKLTNLCRDLDRKYERLRVDYENIKDEYAGSPTFTNHRRLHAVHSRLIKCSEELSESQNRLIEAYWSYFGVKHWQFRLNGDKKPMVRA
ncbi:MAG TPA: hypothetical protein DDW27_17960 [Bacteroidales bacterium]|nr:hypothetical protein [Bacteroidales bacterium]